MTRRFLRLAVVLGLIAAVGPFATDMYLPALPSIGTTLHASPSAVQMSLMVFFITIGLCQLVYGPLSDRIGRKPPIYAGLFLFAAGSIGCAFAPSIEVLIAFRILQGFGACAGMVIPRAIVRDLHTGHDATRLMSMLMLVIAVSPILAPLTGSFVIASFGWHGVFWALTIAAGVAFLLALTLKETRPHGLRADITLSGAFRAYRMLLRDANFIGLVLLGAFGISSFFVYLGSASFVLIDHYGLTPREFSYCFALNAASFFGCTQMTGYLTRRFGLAPVVRVTITGFAAATSLLAVLMMMGADNLFLMLGLLFVGYGFWGLALPTSAVLALERHGRIAGTASALMGSLQFVTGAAVMGLSSLFADHRPQPMVVGIALCAVSAFTMAQIVLRPARVAASAPAE